MHILLLRPDAPNGSDDTGLWQPLLQRGVRFSHAPMIEIIADLTAWPKLLAGPVPVGLILTSRHGLSGLHQRDLSEAWRAVPVWTVGRATAQAARSLGFAHIHCADGTADELVALILQNGTHQGSYVHASGRDHRGDIVERLNAAGHDARRVEIYRAEQLNRLPDAVTADLKRGSITDVVVTSARIAAAFTQIIHTTSGPAQLENCRFWAISHAAAAPLSEAGLRSITVSSAPNLESMASDLLQQALLCEKMS